MVARRHGTVRYRFTARENALCMNFGVMRMARCIRYGMDVCAHILGISDSQRYLTLGSSSLLLALRCDSVRRIDIR
jgi:hypothetical protein